MRTIQLLTFAALVSLGGIAAAENVGNPIPVELRVYDVSDIVRNMYDYPGPDLTLGGAHSTVNPNAPAPVTEAFAASSMVTLIHDRSFAAAFADPATSICEQDTCLVVLQRADVHKQIAQLLAGIRATLRPQVVVKALLVASAEIPQATLFDPEALAKVLGPKGAAGAVASPRLVCSNMQRVHSRSGQMFNYIRDYDVAGAVYDPVVATALDGYVFEVRPTLSGDRSSTEIDLRFQLGARTSRDETRNIVMAPPVAPPRGAANPVQIELKPGEEPAAAAAANPVHVSGAANANRLPIELPAMHTQQIRTQVRIPEGKWILAGVMNNPNAEAKENRLLLFVSAELADKAAGKADEKPKK